jgi:hypothetical protein
MREDSRAEISASYVNIFVNNDGVLVEQHVPLEAGREL